MTVALRQIADLQGTSVVPAILAPPQPSASGLLPAGFPARAPPTPWERALVAAALVAVDPPGLAGVWVKARTGPVRDRWLETLAMAFGPDVPCRRIAPGTAGAQLTGGLDIGQTLQAGRPVIERGVLASADGGVLLLAMAERVSPAAAAIIAGVLDGGAVRAERDGVSASHPARFALVALDEGIDESLPAALTERLGLRLGLDAIGWREAEIPAPLPFRAAITAARVLLPAVTISAGMTEALCVIALRYGGGSIRPALHLMRTARAAAALQSRQEVAPEDAETALWLVLGLSMADMAAVPAEGPADADQPEPRGPREPDAVGERETFEPETGASPPGHAEPKSPEETKDASAAAPSAEALQDMLVAAVAAQLPAGFLAALAAKGGMGGGGAAGRSGAARASGSRGRAVGVSPRPPTSSARLDVLATLRQAAPWQKLRSAPLVGPDARPQTLRIRKADFRYRRLQEKAGTTAIFVVDASGSAAVERLSETKGAIELLLARCYVRRDSVALIAFRGKAADTLLAPTRSLVRAKRCLSALPGGGGTPLAAGILAALELARAGRRKGQSVMTVFLTDGRGNVALDGTTTRAVVAADTARAARLFRADGLDALVIDTAQRSSPRALELGQALGAETMTLPRGGARVLAQAVGSRLDG